MARVYRWLELIDPAQQRFRFCPVWANYLDPPARVGVDTSAGVVYMETGIIPDPLNLRERDRAEYSFPLSASERVAFHPPVVVVAHYNELPAVAANMGGQPLLAVVPDGRVGANEWGEMTYDAFFLAPASDAEDYDAQLARVSGVFEGLKELWGEKITFEEYIPKFSRRAAWETGEKYLRGEWFAIKTTLKLINYELTAM